MKAFLFSMCFGVCLSGYAQQNLYLLAPTIGKHIGVRSGILNVLENRYVYYMHRIYCHVEFEFTTINRDSVITVPLSELWRKYPVQTIEQLAVVLQSMEEKPKPLPPPRTDGRLKVDPPKPEPYFDEGCIRQGKYMASFKHIYIVELDQAK